MNVSYNEWILSTLLLFSIRGNDCKTSVLFMSLHFVKNMNISMNMRRMSVDRHISNLPFYSKWNNKLHSESCLQTPDSTVGYL